VRTIYCPASHFEALLDNRADQALHTHSRPPRDIAFITACALSSTVRRWVKLNPLPADLGLKHAALPYGIGQGTRRYLP
jgi:hypothetical protein